MSEEVKEGPYHEYRDHHDFNCDFCMSGEDAAYYSNLLNKAFHSRDAEVAELKQTIETLTAGFNEQGKVTIQNLVDERNDRRKEALELKDKLKEAMALLEMAEPVLNKHKYCSSVAMESLQLQNEIWNPRYEALKKNV